MNQITQERFERREREIQTPYFAIGLTYMEIFLSMTRPSDNITDESPYHQVERGHWNPSQLHYLITFSCTLIAPYNKE